MASTGNAQAPAPNSIVDYLKSTGRDSSFASRSEHFERLHPDGKYTGTAEQNRELLAVMRVEDVMQIDSTNPTFTPHALSRETEELMHMEVAEQIAASPKLASNSNNLSEIGSLFGKEISANSRKSILRILEGTKKGLPNAMSGDPIQAFSEPINQVRQKARSFNRVMIEWEHKDINDWLSEPPTSGILSKAASEEAADWLEERAKWTHQAGAFCGAAKDGVQAMQAWDSLDVRRVLSSVNALDSEAKQETVRELVRCQQLSGQIEPHIRQAAELQNSFSRNFLQPLKDGPTRPSPDRKSAKMEDWWSNSKIVH